MLNAVQLAIFNGHLTSICEEMGFILQRSAMSPNIKDRLDFSCAFFDRLGAMVAQAAHIPVHLGSMAFAMQSIVAHVSWNEGDCLVVNDPYLGGTHLPDVTLITPLFFHGSLQGFVANRAHHANIGAKAPGSMPLSRSLDEEGVLIKPGKLIEEGQFNPDAVSLLNSIEGINSPRAIDLSGDFLAQLSANKLGIERFCTWLDEIGLVHFENGLEQINQYGRALCLGRLAKLPKGKFVGRDFMESDGFGNDDVLINLQINILDDRILVDFEGTGDEVDGNINCPESVAAAAVYYVYMCLMPDYVPVCQGAFDLVEISIPSRSLLSPSPGKAVAAGNVETSMRIVDVLLAALSQADANLPAAAQGTMNNVAMGASGSGVEKWDYYETVAGGMGASSKSDGLDAVQCHMTNTLNTPVESLEMHYPLRIKSYSLREGSGGRGQHFGGRGVRRQYEFLSETDVTLLTERRKAGPPGLNGAECGCKGENWLNSALLPGKCSVKAVPGDVLTINTPGGGGWHPIEK